MVCSRRGHNPSGRCSVAPHLFSIRDGISFNLRLGIPLSRIFVFFAGNDSRRVGGTVPAEAVKDAVE